LIDGATDEAINAEARQWFIATVEKDELLGVASSLLVQVCFKLMAKFGAPNLF
jgi:hypothetical protein